MVGGETDATGEQAQRARGEKRKDEDRGQADEEGKRSAATRKPGDARGPFILVSVCPIRLTFRRVVSQEHKAMLMLH